MGVPTAPGRMRRSVAVRITPVILSGGAGTRLWPLSRARYPKQFVRALAGTEGCLLQATARRLAPGTDFDAPMVLCNEAHRFLVRDALEEAGIAPRAIVLEPAARNTAPAIAIAARALGADGADAIMAVMPSDHVIQDEARFAETVRQAGAIARAGRLVLLGVPPSRPHTGYGYIRRGAPLEEGAAPDAPAAYRVAGFREKPDAATAERYLAEGGHYWNSGIFVLHVATFLAELERLAPDILEATGRAWAGLSKDLGFLRLERESFAESPSISVDYAIMEKTEAAAVVPLDVGWSDVGSWSALWALAPRDGRGNAVAGRGGAASTSAELLEESRDCYVHAERALVATLGVKNLVIVDTPDALLVADKGRAEEVGGLVARLAEMGRSEHASHLRDHRPWGWFEPLAQGPRFQVKMLHVKPGAKLSLQMHHHRSEHWVVVKGTAKVTIGEATQLLAENESVYIKATQWHRLENPGKVPLEIIEVQIGTYLGEDDIIRAEDAYNRGAEG